MAKNQSIRIRPFVLQTDMEAFIALQAIPNYTPANTAYTQSTLQTNLDAMNAARQLEINTQNALDAARDAAAAAEWNFHNGMLGAKDQVIAQFGDDSNEVQAMGLKKKSERARPTRKSA
ncbi:MAG: hypothetical protein NT121_06340 [Chloroflexi bacterium]|nr:hypothetical protein [Chloroflexota bacterium]